MNEELNFDNLLASMAEDYQKAEAFSNYMPPDGEYTVMFTDLTNGAKETDEGPMAWISLKGKLLDAGNPDIDQKTMTIGFFTSTRWGSMKGFVESLIPVGSTDPIYMIDTNDLSQSVGLLKTLVEKNTLVNLQVVTTTSKKNGKDYQNVNILSVIPDAPADAPEDTSEDAPVEAPEEPAS